MNRGVLIVRFFGQSFFFFSGALCVTLDVGSITFRSNWCDHMFGCILPAVETSIDLRYQLSSFDHEPTILPTYPRLPQTPTEKETPSETVAEKSAVSSRGMWVRSLGPTRWRISSHRAHR